MHNNKLLCFKLILSELLVQTPNSNICDNVLGCERQVFVCSGNVLDHCNVCAWILSRSLSLTRVEAMPQPQPLTHNQSSATATLPVACSRGEIPIAREVSKVQRTRFKVLLHLDSSSRAPN